MELLNTMLGDQVELRILCNSAIEAIMGDAQTWSENEIEVC